MSHDVFGGAADQDMFESGRAVGRSNDQIRAMLDGTSANLLASVPDLERRLDSDSVPLSPFDQFPHLPPRSFLRVLHQQWEVVAHILVTGYVVLKGH